MRNEKVNNRPSIRTAFKAAVRSFFNVYTMPTSDYKFMDAIKSESGVTVTADSALKLSAVYACVRILSEIPASLPIGVTTRDKSGKIIDLSDGPIYQLLHEPNGYMNNFSFTELMNANMQLKGNAVAVIIRNGNGYPIKLIPVSWESTEVKLYKGDVYYIIDDRVIEMKGTFHSTDVIHYKMLSRNGIVGISPLDKAREAIGLGLAAENYGARFFGKGGNYKAVMETDKQLDDPEWKKFNKRINSYTDHDIPLLEYGIKYKDIGISPEQAQFVSSRTFQLQDIARFFNVPPHIIGDLSRATFSNIEHQDIQFVKYSLRSLLKRQEVELETKLAPMDGTEKPDIKYILDGMLRGDTKTRAAYYQALVPLGIITRNEAREEENRSPLPGLDEPLNPANITGKSAEPKPPADPDEDIKPKSDEDAEE